VDERKRLRLGGGGIAACVKHSMHMMGSNCIVVELNNHGVELGDHERTPVYAKIKIVGVGLSLGLRLRLGHIPTICSSLSIIFPKVTHIIYTVLFPRQLESDPPCP